METNNVIATLDEGGDKKRDKEVYQEDISLLKRSNKLFLEAFPWFY